MKKQMLLIASLCSAIALAVIPANAQTGGVQLHVPFEFMVSGKTLPAGEYMMVPSSDLVRIQDAHGKVVAMVLSNDISGRSPGRNGLSTFRCYTGHCFLAEVWGPTQLNGRQLLRSRTEAELLKKENSKYLALLGENPQKR